MIPVPFNIYSMDEAMAENSSPIEANADQPCPLRIIAKTLAGIELDGSIRLQLQEMQGRCLLRPRLGT